MSTILAIETSTEYCSAALLHDERCFARNLRAGQTHSGQILQLVAEVLAEAGMVLADFDAIAFGAGPGSFTGLRIACAVTQGLAYGANLPVIPVSTLSAMAEQLRMQAPEMVTEGTTVLCAMDARMGEIYWSLLAWRKEEWFELVPASLDFPQALQQQSSLFLSSAIPPFDFVCGSALDAYEKELSVYAKVKSDVRVPDARYVACLALRARERGEELTALEAAPLYIRDRVALTTDERMQEKIQAGFHEKTAASSPVSHAQV